jgi:TonB-dependent starch-binding outer membrane protein SusC
MAIKQLNKYHIINQRFLNNNQIAIMKNRTTAYCSGRRTSNDLHGFFKKFLFSSFIILLSIGVQAQNKIHVNGIVKDEIGPTANASVMVKGTKVGVTTDANGAFSIDVPNQKSVLVISNTGYQTHETVVGNMTNFTIDLVASTSQLNEVIVVGYGTQKKVTVTGAVAMVKGSELAKSPAVNLSNSLVGRLPGVTAVQSSGEPGYDGSAIRIRGTNTLGNNSALIVVDGIPERAGGLDRINPNDIESVSILKDASAAIYGARAANGVILITTKHGKTGKPTLTYDFNQGWAQPTRLPKMSNAAQYAEMNNELVLFKDIPENQWSAAWPALQQAGSYTRTNDSVVITAPYSPAAIQKYKDGSDPWGYPNTDWFKATLKEWSPQSRHNLQINGGSENVKFFASLGYSNQDAYYKNSATGFKQYDLRLNLDAKINKYINTSIGLTGREEYRFFPTSGAGSIFRMQVRGKPTEQAIWPNGLPGPDIENGENPVVITTNETGYDRDRRDYIQVNGKIEFLIPGIEGLKITASGAVDKYILRGKRWQIPWGLYFWDRLTYDTVDNKITPHLTKNIRSTFTDPRLTQREEHQLNINLTGLLNYDRSFREHTVNFLAGVTRETVEGDNFSAFRRNYISPAVDQLFAGASAQQSIGGSAFQRARLSYFGRVGYNYKEKYIAEFLWRYDGSYIFPESDRFGFFPGLLAGWNISKEDFFKNKIVDYLKLRLSYGQMGNDQVFFNGALQEYAYLSTYGFSSYIFNDQVQTTLLETRVPNPNFTWEVANNANIGLEGTLLQKINFEFEYFYNKRTFILIAKQGSTPSSTGMVLPPVNLGKVNNKGWEFKVGYNGQSGDLRYNVSVNGGYAKNKIVSWDEAPGAPPYQQSTGHGFGIDGPNYLAYEYDGVFRDEKDIVANTLDYSKLTGHLLPGDMKFKDINGDGKINGDDQTRLDKNRDPSFTGGLHISAQYKNFDLSILFQTARGGLLWIQGAQEGDFGNYLQYTYDHRWSADNPGSVDPRISNRNATYYTGGGYGNNTYWLRTSNYTRLKNIEIGYNVPANLGKRAGISNLRIYANGLNLITWDKMKIWDPESTSGNGHYYPQARIIGFGVRLTF